MPFAGRNPGLYIPGAAQDAIFIRDVGDVYNFDVDGTPFAIDLPTREVNDTLICIQWGIFIQPLLEDGVSWFTNFPNGFQLVINTVNNLRISTRLATNDANDVATANYPAQNDIATAQIISVGNTLGETSKLSLGMGINPVLNSLTPSTNWPMNALGDGGPLTDVLNLAVFQAYHFNQIANPTVAQNTRLTTIDQFGYVKTVFRDGTLWAGWASEYEQTATALPALNLGYTPLTTQRDEATTYCRFEYP